MMRAIVTSIALVLGAVSLCEASHFRYGHIGWTQVDDNPNDSNPYPRKIRIKFDSSWRRSAGWVGGNNKPVGSVAGSYCVSTPGSSSHTSVCGDNILTQVNPTLDYIVGTVDLPLVTYPHDGPFTISFSMSCRVGGLRNSPPCQSFTSAQVRFVSGRLNASPVSNVPSINFVSGEVGGPGFLMPAMDPDGDPMLFRRDTLGNNNAYGLGAFKIHPSNGQVTFDPVGTTLGLYAVAFKIYDYDYRTCSPPVTNCCSGATFPGLSPPCVGSQAPLSDVIVDFVIQIVAQQNHCGPACGGASGGSCSGSSGCGSCGPGGTCIPNIPPFFVIPPTPPATEIAGYYNKLLSFTAKASDNNLAQTVRITSSWTISGMKMIPTEPFGIGSTQGSVAWTIPGSAHKVNLACMLAEDGMSYHAKFHCVTITIGLLIVEDVFNQNYQAPLNNKQSRSEARDLIRVVGQNFDQGLIGAGNYKCRFIFPTGAPAEVAAVFPTWADPTKIGKTEIYCDAPNMSAHVTPAIPSRAMVVEITRDGGTRWSTNARSMTWTEVPWFQSFAPNSGSECGGTKVLITGYFYGLLAGISGVKLGTAASATCASRVEYVDATTSAVTGILCTYPPGLSAAGPIQVSTAYGTVWSTGSYTVHPRPYVTAVTPKSGSVEPIEIHGFNFLNVERVELGGVKLAIAPSDITPNVIKSKGVWSLTGATGPELIYVNTTKGCDSGVGPVAFTFTAPNITATDVLTSAGGPITLHGYNFGLRLIDAPYLDVLRAANPTMDQTLLPKRHNVLIDGRQCEQLAYESPTVMTCFSLPHAGGHRPSELVAAHYEANFTVSYLPDLAVATDPPPVIVRTGQVTIPNFAIVTSPDPVVEIVLTSISNLGVFAASSGPLAPAIDTAGTLTYTPSTSATGTATLTVVAKTIAAGEVFSSASAKFTVRVDPYPRPVITGVYPNSWSNCGGTVLHLLGFYLAESAGRLEFVGVGGVACDSFGYVNETAVTCLRGPGDSGEFVVRSVEGTAQASFPPAVVLAPTVKEIVPPFHDAQRSATRLALIGSNLGISAADLLGIKFGNIQCTDPVWTNIDRIECTIPGIPGVPDFKAPAVLVDAQGRPVSGTDQLSAFLSGSGQEGLRFVQPDRSVARRAPPTVSTKTFCQKTTKEVEYRWMVPEVTSVVVDVSAASASPASNSSTRAMGVVAAMPRASTTTGKLTVSQGDILGGYEVHIYGHRLGNSDVSSIVRIDFPNNTPCDRDVHFISPSHISCVVGPSSKGNDTVNVTTVDGGISWSTGWFKFIPPRPSITSVFPQTFVRSGGDYITVYGSLFLVSDETPIVVKVGRLPCQETLRVVDPESESGELLKDAAVCVMLARDVIKETGDPALFTPVTDSVEGHPYLADPIYYDKGIDFAALGDQTSEDGGYLRLVVSLSKIPTKDVIVTVNVPDSTEAFAGNNVTFSPVDYFRPRTITIVGIHDEWRDHRTPFVVETLPAESDDEKFKGNDPLDLVFYSGDSKPVVDSIDPPNSYLAGRDITLIGRHFDCRATIYIGNKLINESMVTPLAIEGPGYAADAAAAAANKTGSSGSSTGTGGSGGDVSPPSSNGSSTAPVGNGTGALTNKARRGAGIMRPAAAAAATRPEASRTSANIAVAPRSITERLVSWFRGIDSAYAPKTTTTDNGDGDDDGDDDDDRDIGQGDAAVYNAPHPTGPRVRRFPPRKKHRAGTQVLQGPSAEKPKREFDPKVLNSSRTWCADPRNIGAVNATTGRPKADFSFRSRGAIWAPQVSDLPPSRRSGRANANANANANADANANANANAQHPTWMPPLPLGATHRAAQIVRLSTPFVGDRPTIAAQHIDGVHLVPREMPAAAAPAGAAGNEHHRGHGKDARPHGNDQDGRRAYHANDRHRPARPLSVTLSTGPYSAGSDGPRPRLGHHIATLAQSWAEEEARYDHQVVELWFRAPPMDDGYHDITVINGVSGTTGTRIGKRGLYYTDDCNEPGMWGRGQDCSPCVEGGVCPGGYRLRPEGGFWNRGETDDWVYQCLPPEACRGWVETEDGGVPTLCNSPYTGDYCVSCEEGFYHDGIYCLPCPSEESLMIMLVCSVLLWLVFAMCGWWLENRENLAHVIALIMALQSIGGVGGTVRHTFKSERLRQIYDVVEYFTGNIRFLKPGCFNDQPYLPNYAIGLAFNILVGMPLICGVPIVSACASWWHRSDGPMTVRERKSHYRNRFVRCVIIYLTVIYLSISTQAFESFSCFKDPEGVWRLRTRRNFVCYSNDHLIVLGLSGSLLLLVTFGFPAAFVVWMLRNTDHLYTDYTFMQRYDFLYDPFMRPFKYLWILELFVLGLGFAVSETLFVGFPTWQFIGLASVFSLLIVILVVLQPMRRGWENWVLLLLHCSNLAAVTINYLSETGQLDEDLGAALVFILLISLFAASLTFVIVVVYYVIVSWPEKPEWERMIPEEYRERVLGDEGDEEEVRDLVAKANENVIGDLELDIAEEVDDSLFTSIFGGSGGKSSPSFGLWDGIVDSTQQLGKRVSVAVGLRDETVDSMSDDSDSDGMVPGKKK